MPAILFTPLSARPECQADMVGYRRQGFVAHQQVPVQTELLRNLNLVTRTNITPYLRPLFELSYLKKAGLDAQGRMRLTEKSDERLTKILEHKDGDAHELRAVIATIQRVV